MPLRVAIVTRAEPSKTSYEVLLGAGFEVVWKPSATEDDVINAAADADGLLATNNPLTTRRVLDACPRLKVVSRNGVGVDSVDLDAATELGICVTNSPGVNTTEVADHAMALLLSITRKVRELDAAVHQGRWESDMPQLDKARGQLRRIAGNTVGIIGFGNIGRAFAQRARGFGPARIIAHDPYVPQTAADLYGVQLVDLDTLLSESDFITVHTALTAETRHMMDRDAFRKMKKTAVFINCARGPVVDESALNEALSQGYIAAAGIDVTEKEPLPSESPLLKQPNLTITPHFAGSSPVSAAESAKRWPENVVRVLRGQYPHGLANPDVLKRIAVMRAAGKSRWDGIPELPAGRGF
jgi:D-3-phosphoglycerate dehydrogenase